MEETLGSLERGRGLMGRKELSAGSGMMIGGGFLPLMWIHTFFMRFALDLVYLDRGGRIVRIMESVRPWRLTPPVFGARSVLELPAGAVHRTQSRAGDVVRFEDVN